MEESWSLLNDGSLEDFLAEARIGRRIDLEFEDSSVDKVVPNKSYTGFITGTYLNENAYLQPYIETSSFNPPIDFLGDDQTAIREWAIKKFPLDCISKYRFPKD